MGGGEVGIIQFVDRAYMRLCVTRKVNGYDLKFNLGVSRKIISHEIVHRI